MVLAKQDFTTGASGRPALSPLARAVMGADVPTVAENFRRWRSEGISDLPKLAGEIAAGFNFNRREQRIVSAAAKLAAEPNDNPFHGNRHFLEVFATAAMLAHDAIRDGAIDRRGAARLLTAALVHDYGHDGGTNGAEQFRLERIAVDRSKSALAEAGASRDDLKAIETIILATDVSRDFANPDSRSPASTMKKFAASGRISDLHPALRGPDIAISAKLALIGEDADIGSSLLHPQLFRESGELLAKEQNRPFTPGGQVFFFDHICQRRMASPPGQKIIQPVMNRIMKDYGVSPPNFHCCR